MTWALFSVIVASVASVIGVILGGVRLWPIVKRLVAVLGQMERLPEMADQVEALTVVQAQQTETLATIAKETKPNGGGSMNDALRRTEADGKATLQKLDEHIRLCKAVERRRR